MLRRADRRTALRIISAFARRAKKLRQAVHSRDVAYVT
jgi:hypothetical protein